MQKIKFMAVSLLLAAQPVFGIVELGADVGYFSAKQTAKVTSTSGATATQLNTFTGAIFSGYAHLTFGVPSVITIGIGPNLAFSSPTSSDYPSGVSKEEQSYTRIGADLKVQAEMIPGFSPYARVMVGKDSISWTEANSIVTQTYSTGGLYYNALLGFQIPLAPAFALYVQGGITGAPASTLTIKTITVNGVSQSFTQTGTAETSYSGALISVGARLSF